ncbi:hypothetical protein L209DRAFT_751516 [Thermothelomyces heterothallicus CBS 203.75]
MPANFATPLPQSPRSDILEWRFPRPYHNLTLTGRSRAAWHTSFVIPQLNLLLDAGLVVNNLRPKHIFLTHGHSDHTLLTPAFVKRSDPPDIYCPAEMKDALDGFINAKTMLNEGGGIWPPESTSPYLQKYINNKKGGEPSSPDAEDGVARRDPSSQADVLIEDDDSPTQEQQQDAGDDAGDDDDDGIHPLLHTHRTHPLRPGSTVTLARLAAPQTYTATAFACDHTVPCLGYVFSAVTPKLKPEYRGLAGAELRALRQERGVEITAPVATPVFAFLGDTTASVLASGPEWLGGGGGGSGGGVRVVITECSFLWEEHRDQADRTRHTIWADLDPVVRRYPDTVFVLMHFSLRYSDEEVRAFFRERDVPENVVVWVDGVGG